MASRKQEKEQRKQERLAAEQEEAAAGRRRKLFAGLGAAALAAVVVVVALVVISQSGDDGGDGAGSGAAADVDSELAGVSDRGTILGDRNADVTIVEFGDLQCPACQGFSEQIVPELVDKAIQPGDANMEFRNYTIIGPESITAAKAALAASEQNRYWHFVELFYRNQGAENSGYVTDEFLTDIARGAGVSDLDAWEKARNDPRWDDVLAKTQKQAAANGFTGTPSVLVEGPGGTEALGTPGSAQDVLDAVDSVR